MNRAVEIIREECCVKCKARICETCNVGEAIERIREECKDED